MNREELKEFIGGLIVFGLPMILVVIGLLE
jgi:hypothetical protein